MATSSLPSIYSFNDFAAFLQATIEEKKLQRSTFSLRNFSKRIGLRAPSLLSMVLSGERQPSPALLQKICLELRLSKKDTNYALALVAFHRAKTPSQKAYLAEQLVALKPKRMSLLLELHQLRLFSNWCYAALLLLPELEDFNPEPTWISKRLGGHLAPSEVKKELMMLAEIGIISLNTDGSYRRINAHTESPGNVSIEIVRQWHKQMLSHAKDAIDQQTIEERFIVGTSLTFHPDKMIEAQEYLDDVRKEFRNRFSEGVTHEIYHLGIQFFRLTEPRPS